MASSKQVKKAKSVVDITQDKINEIKLDAQVEAVKHNKPINISDEITFHAKNVRSAFSDVQAWAKQKHLGKQTKEFLDLLTDGVSIFLTRLIQREKSGK